MIDILLYGLLGLAAAALLYNFIRRIARSRSDLGIEGKLIWMDKGRSTKPFFNQVFEVLGKPDLMYRVRGGVLAVEYKSRNGPVFDSDVTQAFCAALAARGEGYRVTQVLIKTSAVQKMFKLPTSDKALFDRIQPAVFNARQAKFGYAVPSRPEIKKCRSCGFRGDCEHSAV